MMQWAVDDSQQYCWFGPPIAHQWIRKDLVPIGNLVFTLSFIPVLSPKGSDIAGVMVMFKADVDAA